LAVVGQAPPPEGATMTGVALQQFLDRDKADHSSSLDSSTVFPFSISLQQQTCVVFSPAIGMRQSTYIQHYPSTLRCDCVDE
jgi:hypothetical protein